MNRYHLIIPCAGSGSRFGSATPKQYHKLANKTVLDWTLDTFTQISALTSITVVYSAIDDLITEYIQKFPNVSFLPVGGSSRAESVLNGLRALNVSDDDWVLVHDAARCCINSHDVHSLIEQLTNDDVGGILATPAIDTIKQINPATNLITATIDRNLIYQAQTPQMFRYNQLLTALTNAPLDLITDEASAIERSGAPVKVVAAKFPNFKITYAADIELAEFILTRRNNHI